MSTSRGTIESKAIAWELSDDAQSATSFGDMMMNMVECLSIWFNTLNTAALIELDSWSRFRRGLKRKNLKAIFWGDARRDRNKGIAIGAQRVLESGCSSNGKRDHKKAHDAENADGTAKGVPVI
jgi:hypothetical protein